METNHLGDNTMAAKVDLEGFAARVREAMDNSTAIPEHGRGRFYAVARRMGVTHEAVRRWATGASFPRLRSLERLAEVLDVDPGWLATGDSPRYGTARAQAQTELRSGAHHRGERQEVLDSAAKLAMAYLQLCGIECESAKGEETGEFVANFAGKRIGMKVSSIN